MKRIKVLGLFRIPVSYINSLLEEFSKAEEIEFKVLFCLMPKDKSIFPKNIDYGFLDHSEEAFINNEHSERDYQIYQKSIVKELESFQPDVFLVGTGYLMPTTWVAIKAAKKMGIPIITRMTTEAVPPNSLLRKIAKKIIVGTYCKKVNAGVYECSVQKNYMIHYGMKEENLFYSPCSVNNDYFSELFQKYTKEEAKKKLGIENDCIVIVDTAELIPRKRPFDLVRAMQKINCSTGTKAFFIGKGHLKDELYTYLGDHSINNCVLCGRLTHDEMAVYLCAADIFVMPSENDASPKALNEAMNFKVAIVISDGICTSKELCVNGENGFVYPVGDVDKLAECLEKILCNPSQMVQMGEKSKKIVSEFTYENAVKGWRKAILHVLDRE